MFLFEFLNRISFFSVLTWSFYLIAVLCALILTNYASPLIRKYRKSLIAVGVSSLILGTLSVSSPIFLNKLNPSQSRLTPIDALVTTLWEEPVSNPETSLPDDEVRWTKDLPYHFKYKLQLPEPFKKVLTTEGSELAYLDDMGNLRGYNAYTGLNHWHIPVHATQVLDQLQAQRKFFLLDETVIGQLRISCFDLVNPSLLWQRTIPNSKDGALAYDIDSQSVIVSAGNSGVWSLKEKTGEVLWKRPEVFSRTKVIVSQKHLVVFEPVVATKPGSWYFLDASNGKTLQKIPHVYTDMQAFMPFDSGTAPSTSFMGRVDAENFFYLNHTDLSQIWNFHAPEKIQVTKYVDADRYLLLYDSELELRKLSDNAVLYQKKLSGITPSWLKVSPDRTLLTIPSTDDDGVQGVSFFNLETGEYQATARTSEPILDLLFFGDWMYLYSENYVWAFKK